MGTMTLAPSSPTGRGRASRSVSTIRCCWTAPLAGRSQRIVPPSGSRPTRSRRARYRSARATAARTHSSSGFLGVPRVVNVSRRSTMAVFRSGCMSLTTSSPVRALACQLTRRRSSPSEKGRNSANSIPSPFERATWSPTAAWVPIGRASVRSASRTGYTLSVASRSSVCSSATRRSWS